MEEKIRVYISTDTVRGILLETWRHPHLESIVQIPGIRDGNDFFFDYVSDSGIDAEYNYCSVEKDHKYADHLSGIILDYYDISKEKITISQVHRHPDNYKHFSENDRQINQALAKEYGGVVNGLVFVAPYFEIKFWYVDEDGNETPVEYIIDDNEVRNRMPKKSILELKKIVEIQEHPEIFHGENIKKEVLEAPKKKIELDSINSSVLSELSEISYSTPIYCKKFPDSSMLIHINKGGDRYLKLVPKGNKSIIITKNQEFEYEKGLIQKLIEEINYDE